MNIGKAKELCDQIPKEHIPLMKMIDKKIDNDMNKVLNKMDSLKAEIKGEMGTMHKLLWGTIIGLGLVLIAGIVSMVIAIYNK